MRTSPWIAVVGAMLLFANVAAADEARPNLILIVADDLGYGDVGFHGCRDIPTPQLDALAAAGVRFTAGYVSAPHCSPSRAGLLVGRYQQRFGHEFNPDAEHGLPTTETTLAERLQQAGYATGMVGKWHLGERPELRPQRRGFTEFFGFLIGGDAYFNSAALLRGDRSVQEKEYLTDAFAREAVDFIERHRARPFFLYLPFNAVHTPRQADAARLARFSGIADPMRQTYAAMLTALDDAVGRVRAKLVELNIEQNTLIVFLSDNGGPVLAGTSTTRNGSSNAPLRGSKRTTLEGGIRVPYVVCWPGRLRPGVYDQPVLQLDATATMLAAADIKVPAERLDGVDLLPFLLGNATGAPHEALYWRFGEQMAIRVGDYKLVRYDVAADMPSGGAREGQVTPARLYRLSDDLGETNDLSAALPDEVRRLQLRWDAWNATLAAPAWPPQH